MQKIINENCCFTIHNKFHKPHMNKKVIMMKDFKIASCQMDIVDNKEKNIEHASKLINEAVLNNAELVTLPEMFNTPYSNEKFIENAEHEEDSYTLNYMKEIAKKNRIYLQCGSIPEKDENNIYNTAYMINPNGKIIGKYRKMHMFDINTENMKFTESDTLTAGNNITTIKTPLANISIAICYDIRFPELWTLITKNNTDIVLLPGAFNTTTGPLHWETLIRGRAIDNQIYVVATSPSQINNPYYIAWGHSMIVNPWGKIIAKAKEDETILYANITSKDVKDVREQIPILKNKRRDFYETIKK